MTIEHTVRIRLSGLSEDAIDEATAALLEAIGGLRRPAMLEMHRTRAGRKGVWLRYGHIRLLAPDPPSTEPREVCRLCDPESPHLYSDTRCVGNPNCKFINVDA